MGNKAAYDTCTATEESGKRRRGERASLCFIPINSSRFTQSSAGKNNKRICWAASKKPVLNRWIRILRKVVEISLNL
ncbi:hypothetical protein EYF80_028161 [Liparis tanakae]|uniref:Uncharacterized protein n=1 Tax=Liparis tanakae TaxID=230148 RepID=A0A4Z2H7B8_9TELE|nr:hypothetical protein EYF80_028161 [Liparis tanakae]